MQKKSEQDFQREVEQRLREIELLEQEARQQGLGFSGLNEEGLRKKLQRESSPYIYSQSWTPATTAGSSANYSVYIANPDPAGHYPVFVSIFFGAANFLDDIGEGLNSRDTRWPYLSTGPFSLAPGGNSNKTFFCTTPTGVPPSTYVGNAVVWRGDFHDRGVYFDRGLFYVTLS
jgi:hypothetical protein